MSEYSRRILAYSALAIVIGTAVSLGVAYLPQSVSSPTTTSNTTTLPLAVTSASEGEPAASYSFVGANPGIISLDGSVELCANNCVYPSPFLEASVSVNSSSQLTQLNVYINATLEQSLGSFPNMTVYSDIVKLGPNNATIPIIAGHSYTVEFKGTFANNDTSSFSVIVTAGPVQLSNSVSCSSEYYTVEAIESFTTGSSTTYTQQSSETVSQNGTSYTTTTSVSDAFGDVTTTTSYFTGTLTGAYSQWTVIVCTYG